MLHTCTCMYFIDPICLTVKYKFNVVLLMFDTKTTICYGPKELEYAYRN